MIQLIWKEFITQKQVLPLLLIWVGVAFFLLDDLYVLQNRLLYLLVPTLIYIQYITLAQKDESSRYYYILNSLPVTFKLDYQKARIINLLFFMVLNAAVGGMQSINLYALTEGQWPSFVILWASIGVAVLYFCSCGLSIRFYKEKEI